MSREHLPAALPGRDGRVNYATFSNLGVSQTDLRQSLVPNLVNKRTEVKEGYGSSAKMYKFMFAAKLTIHYTANGGVFDLSRFDLETLAGAVHGQFASRE